MNDSSGVPSALRRLAVSLPAALIHAYDRNLCCLFHPEVPPYGWMMRDESWRRRRFTPVLLLLAVACVLGRALKFGFSAVIAFPRLVPCLRWCMLFFW